MRDDKKTGQEETSAADRLPEEEIELLYEDCKSNLGEIETGLMDIIDYNIKATPEFISRGLRGFHSVNGAAVYLRNEAMTSLSRAAESVLTEFGAEAKELTIADAETLLSAVDLLKQMTSAEDRRSIAASSVGGELVRLNAILSRQQSAPSAELKIAEGIAEASKSVHEVPVQSSPVRRLKVLIAEDDSTARTILQGLLAKYGDCDVALNGREAVDAFIAAWRTGKGYDLICMDIRMPEMDGTEAVQEIRSLEKSAEIYSSKGVKIFMTTTVRDMKIITTSFRALCDTYLLKPIDGAQLEENMRICGLLVS